MTRTRRVRHPSSPSAPRANVHPQLDEGCDSHSHLNLQEGATSMSDMIQQSRIALRSFKSAEFASEETLCFSAVVVFDGKPIADAKNEGRGGATFLYAHQGAHARLAEAE